MVMFNSYVTKLPEGIPNIHLVFIRSVVKARTSETSKLIEYNGHSVVINGNRYRCLSLYSVPDNMDIHTPLKL